MTLEPWIDNDKRRGTYIVRWRNQAGKILRDEYTYHNRSDAKVRKNIVRDRLIKGSLGQIDTSRLVADAIRDFCKEMEIKGSRRLHNYVPALKRFSQYAVTMGDLTKPKILDFMTSLYSHQLSDQTISTYMSVVSTWLNWCVKHEWLKSSPYIEIGVPQPKKVSRYFTDIELRDLEANIRGDDFRVIFRIGYEMGLRPGEIIRIKNSDILWFSHTNKGELSIAPDENKTERGRIVPLPSTIYDLLPKREGLLFPGWTVDRISRRFKRLKVRSKLAPHTVKGRKIHKTFYWTRHTYAKRFLEAGGSLKVLSDRMGHASITMTADVYGHMERENIKETIVPSIFAEQMRSKLVEINGQVEPSQDIQGHSHVS